MGLFADGDPKFEAIAAEEAAMVDSAEIIAAAIEHAGINQSELADRLGVSKAEISHRLRGERNITVRKLAATLHSLGAGLELGVRLVDVVEPNPVDRWISPNLSPDDHHSAVSVRGYRIPSRAGV